jgi:hypothetical protein
MTRGIVMFAHNSEFIDYGELAVRSAKRISQYIDVPVSLITDKPTIDWLNRDGAKLSIFDKIIEIPTSRVTNGSGLRKIMDSASTQHIIPWHNGTRRLAYEMTPYHETILLDVDYVVQSGDLNLLWGNTDEIAFPNSAVTIFGEELHDDRYISAIGPFLYWATVVYFRKGYDSERFFNLVDHVSENYPHYKMLYRLPGNLFRNDYTFSIAQHILSGHWVNRETYPLGPLLTVSDRDELVRLSGDSATVLINDKKESWKFKLGKISGRDFHCMNKHSLLRII